MKTIRHTRTLVYYDGVQVFEGRDRTGGYYAGVMIDTTENADRYLVTGVIPERLRQFQSGTLDLRTLLLDNPLGEWYIAQVDDDFVGPLALELQDGLLAKTAFLPEAGFLLDEAPLDDSMQR